MFQGSLNAFVSLSSVFQEVRLPSEVFVCLRGDTASQIPWDAGRRLLRNCSAPGASSARTGTPQELHVSRQRSARLLEKALRADATRLTTRQR